MRLIIVSGYSGSGKSVALHTLEDVGYYCVDNLPIELLPQLIDLLATQVTSVAVSMDIRNLSTSSAAVDQALQSLSHVVNLQLLFLEADHSILLQRYRDTQRRHPLLHDSLSLINAIDAEKALLTPIRARADLVVDTSRLSLHQLAEIMHTRLLEHLEHQLVLVFESFGFKYGVPRNADYLFDVRFLPNPHWDRQLRPLTGLDQSVRQFLMCQPEVAHFIEQTCDYLTQWLPKMEHCYRRYLTISVGCTGGRHRSVYVVEQLAQHFQSCGKHVQLRHTALASMQGC